jgi:hypothetical protein
VPRPQKARQISTASRWDGLSFEPLPPVLVLGIVDVHPAVAVAPSKAWNGNSLGDLAGWTDSTGEVVSFPWISDGFRLGLGVSVGLGVGAGVVVRLGVAVGLGVGVAVGLGVGVAHGFAVTVGFELAEAPGEALAEALAEAPGDALAEAPGDALADAPGEGEGVGCPTQPLIEPAFESV